MASEYKYDESSETWPYFVLAVLVFVLLPVSISYVANLFGGESLDSAKTKGAILENHKTLALPNAAELEKLRLRSRTDRLLNKSLVFIVLGWALVAYIWITYAKEVSLQAFFDPHTILDISYSATEKEIKSRYRKLSLQYHPDKIAKDLSDEAKKEMEAAFIRINLAYKALTDETTKNNLRLYGHPDGQQDITHGIALPKFLVEGKYSSIMIVVYFLLIGVLLPYLVGSWWNNVKATTKKGLYVNTAAVFARHLVDKNPCKVYSAFDILDLVLRADEVAALQGLLSTEEVKALVMEYLDRKVSDKHERVKLEVVAVLPKLIRGFVDIATVFRLPDVVNASYELQKALAQASSPLGKHKELLQLPYVNKAVVEAQPVKKLGKLLTLSEEEAGQVLGITDAKQLKTALAVAAKIPFIRVLDASFRVPGEDAVTPNSTTHLVVKFLVKSARLKSCPDIEDERLGEVESFEDLKDPLQSNGDAPVLPAAYAPYFPKVLANAWEGIIVSQFDTRFVENSEVVAMDRVDLSNLELSQKDWISGAEDKVVISTFKIRMTIPAPAAVGTYHYRLLLKNNAYFGPDVDIPLEMAVVGQPVNASAVNKAMNPAEDDGLDSDSDISDPEEDSLAGALAALRGQKVKKIATDDQSDDELDTQSIFTDINTDTEDEDDA